MKLQAAAALMSLAIAAGLSAPVAWSAQTGDRAAATPIQYAPPYSGRYPAQPYYPDDRRDGYYPPGPPPRGGYDPDYERNAPLWRPGDVLPGNLLDYVVDDWERRGLERPPGGHFWVRVDPQFILVRERDRMIARIVSFD